MMNILRNPEIKKYTVIHLIITAVFTALCFFIKPFAAVICALMGVTMLTAYLICERSRCRELEKLCNDIDRILHGDEKIAFSEYREGELSILKSEIGKLTIRLREQNAALRDERMKLKDSMADISHQLRTPLTSMNLIVTLLGGRELSRIEQVKHLQSLTDLLSRTQWLIDVLLKLSQFDAGVITMQSERIDCAELIRKSTEPFEISAELKCVEFDIKIGEGAGFTGDMKWSCEAIGNILKNCMEHTPENSRITITAEESPIFTEISISDCGKGIAQKDLPHIFERFYRSDGISENGYGIGLALAKHIVNAQDGIIQAKNGENGGAVFLLRIYKTVL